MTITPMKDASWLRIAAVLLVMVLKSATSLKGQDTQKRTSRQGADAPGPVQAVGWRPMPVVAPIADLRHLVMLVDGKAVAWVSPSVRVDDDELSEEEPQSSAEVRIDDSSFDQLLFGSDSQKVGSKLTVHLQLRIDAIERICGLTDVQKQKLRLAGRGDIKRFFDCVKEVRKSYQSRFVDDDDIRGKVKVATDLSREAQDYRQRIEGGPFFEGSLFAKTLRTHLDGAQASALDQANRRLPAVVTRSADLRPAILLKQAEQVERPPR